VLELPPPLEVEVPVPPVPVFPPVPVDEVEPPVLVFPPLLVDELEPPLLPAPPEELLLELLLEAELPPLAELVLLDFAVEPPWVELEEELPPVPPVSPPESFEQDATSAGRPTHRVAKSSFFMDEPPRT
jgi:hypothetical protein